LRKGKLGKARLIPVSKCTALQLAAYADERDRLLERSSQPFFVADHGERVSEYGARYNFAVVCQSLGLRERQRFHRHGRGPRIHDLRHNFAVRTMLNWYRSGMDPAREMIKLTTYLGHANPEHTYWYIEAVPELLALASARAERSIALEGRS
jgi:integrase/recombinase XerD